VADKIRILNIPITRLENNPWNPNIIDERTFARLKEEISSIGFIEPIQVVPLDSGNYQIVGGEHRVKAARELSFEKVPAIVLCDARWKDEDLKKFVTVRLNVLHGKLDPTRMVQLYDEMAKKYGQDALRKLFAFTDTGAWKQLLTSIKRGLKQAGMPKSTVDQFDEDAKTTKSVDELASILNTLFAKYGDTLDSNFMVFTHGKRKHLYIQCSKESWSAVKKLADKCAEKKVDINEFLIKPLSEASEAVKKVEAAPDDSEVVF
jgi:hypothetical protein